VDVKVKRAVDLRVRIPEWVKAGEAVGSVNGSRRRLELRGRYAELGTCAPGEVATLEFPIAERSGVIHVEKRRYALVRKGNEVVVIDPPGVRSPLYQRDHYRVAGTRWKTARRFVPENTIPW
jgi:hypothetical protein